MKVICVAQLTYENRKIDWPEDWPVPKVGDEFALSDAVGLFVRKVIFYPMGDAEVSSFVYVVLGPRSVLSFINSER